jgi:hypothetical protein
VGCRPTRLLSPAPSGAFFRFDSSPSTRQLLVPSAEWACSRQQPSLRLRARARPRVSFSGRAFLWCARAPSRRAARLVRGDNRDARSILRNGTNNAPRDIEKLLSSGDFPKLRRCGSGKPARIPKRRGRSQRMAAPWITNRARGGEMGDRVLPQRRMSIGSCRRGGGSKKKSLGALLMDPEAQMVGPTQGPGWSVANRQDTESSRGPMSMR